MTSQIIASCSCSQVTFKSAGKPVIQLCCHCKDCRDSLKTDYAEIAFFAIDTVEVKGTLSRKTYVADSGKQTARESCSDCGEVMFDRSEGFPNLLGVMSDRIQAPFESKPAFHVWTSSKLPEVKIPTGIPQYEKGFG